MSDYGPESSFTSRRGSGPAAGIDFAQARRIECGGATCEAFDARYLHRRVFVKKLRDSSSPTLRAAFAKEAEIGMNLSHPSLPVYRFFSDNCIVMDFIDGDTLASMIAARDPWLADPANIRRLLGQLTDVIAYLHSMGVVHCDVKPDNVIITAGTRNAVLIDLGEAYTAAIDDTPGDPAVYGLDSVSDVGSPDIDYYGLGAIVDRLADAGFPCGRYAAFRRLCEAREVDPARLTAALDTGSRRRWIWISAAVITTAAAAAVTFFLLQKPEPKAPPETSATVAPTVRTDTVYIEREVPVEVEIPAAPQPDPLEFQKIIGKELTHRFDDFLAGLDSTEVIVARRTMNQEQLGDLINAIVTVQNEIISSLSREYKARFPDVPPSQIDLAIYDSKAGQVFYRRVGSVTKAIADEISRLNDL